MQRGRLAPRVAAEQRRAPASARSSPSRTRIVVDLPAPFGPEEAVHLALGDLQVQPVERADGPKVLTRPAIEIADMLHSIHKFVNVVNRVKSREVTDGGARFVERFAAVLDEGGVPRMPARVFAALLAHGLRPDDRGRARRGAAGQPGGGLRRGALPDPGQPGRARARARLTARRLPRSHDDLWYEAIVNREPLLDALAAARSRTASRRSAPTRPRAAAGRDSASSSRSSSGRCRRCWRAGEHSAARSP